MIRRLVCKLGNAGKALFKSFQQWQPVILKSRVTRTEKLDAC